MLNFPYTQTGAELWFNHHEISNPHDVFDQTQDEFGSEIQVSNIVHHLVSFPDDVLKVYECPKVAKDIIRSMATHPGTPSHIVNDLVELNWKKFAFICYIIADDEGLLDEFVLASDEIDDPSTEISEVIFLDNSLSIVFEESNV